eukprot:scaffold120320_cov33-Tisochrysis_lutea.AAC.3
MNPDQIIVMAVDDIANYASNPFPGKVFNKPSDIGDAGVDVYEGCAIDYSGALVTPETFKKVLLGDADGLNGGKVLQSTKNDRVFVNFVDHGGVNLIGFPKSTVRGILSRVGGRARSYVSIYLATLPLYTPADLAHFYGADACDGVSGDSAADEHCGNVQRARLLSRSL